MPERNDDGGGATELTRGQELLLRFLRDHDAECPVCGYNLRGLTRPVCPECSEELAPTVGVEGLRLGWLFAAIAPGFFSGIAACFVAIPTVAIYFEDGVLVWPLVGAVLFGWMSGLFAIVLATKLRSRFIAKPNERRRSFAILVWLVHVAAMAIFIVTFALYI
ncbi:MAG: hypothetical protein ACF8PN_03710 [Phycisphaerales bacterium]